MHSHFLYNDEIRTTDAAVVSPGQVGFMNGWGVFSTIRVYDGEMFLWDRHWARIERDARKMHVPLPAAEDLEQQLYRLLDANAAYNSTLRVAIIRNKGGMFEGPHVHREFDVVAFTRDVANWGDSVKLGMVPHARHAQSEFAGVKMTSWSQNLTWYERANQQGLDEVVLLNERNEVSECTSANIFTVFENRVFTPQLQSSGCLAGITRDVLLNDVHIPGVEINEHVLLPADLESADEVFITSTTREILPVKSIEGLNLRQGRKVINALREAFQDFTRKYTLESQERRKSKPIA